MSLDRRRFLFASAALLAGCSRNPISVNSNEIAPVEDSVNQAVTFLQSRQSRDGSWRSDVYGQFKDGTALTPLVVHALQEARADHGTGLTFLEQLTDEDGKIRPPEYGFDYPIYTAALTLMALKSAQKPFAPWLKYIQERQLTETLGWRPEDREYGGWGYARALPRKPEPGKITQPLVESNLSATVYALEALRAAGVSHEDPIYARAMIFLQRCQNWAPDENSNSAFDDGGFHFIYGDPVRNKAGVAGIDGAGQQRFHSYGSSTADGLRAMLLCGVKSDALRVKAAREWLLKNFTANAHPGKYAKAHERNRDAVYFYYCDSVASAFKAVDVPESKWVQPLVDALRERQHKDGSWRNGIDLVREDDPIVATCFALGTLCQCRPQSR